MAKDPAFLFYPQRWLEGTAELTPEERGVYIDLLAHQHQKGSIPSEMSKLSRLVRLSDEEFCPIWRALSCKFVPTENNRLVNRTLNEIVTERSTKSVKNRITGTLASIIRNSKISSENKEIIKKSFKIEDFLTVPTEFLTERLTEWFEFGSKSIINGNTNGNGNGIDRGAGKGISAEIPTDSFFVGQMLTIWIKSNPTYTVNKKYDLPACREIGSFIFNTENIVNGFGDAESEKKALAIFELLTNEIKADPFWVGKPLNSVSTKINQFYSKIKNPQNGAAYKRSVKQAKPIPQIVDEGNFGGFHDD